MIEKMDDNVLELMQSLGDLRQADFKDEYDDLCDHCLLVANVAYLLAEQMGHSKEECMEYARAGMAHDIGKLEIANIIRDRRTDILKIEEMKYIRNHPQLGYSLLYWEGGFSQTVMDSVRFHHENYDGTGYPENLVGEAIPYGARIIRICDVFSALVSERPYRPAYDKEMAIELMISEVKHFDMRMFLQFLSVIHSVKFDEIDRMIKITNRKGYIRLKRKNLIL